MTFIAQPYEQFVDDLLTALTGGFAREEHQFRKTDDLYRLAAPDVDPGTVVVFGQYNEDFLLFERGADYTYSEEKEGAGLRNGSQTYLAARPALRQRSDTGTGRRCGGTGDAGDD